MSSVPVNLFWSIFLLNFSSYFLQVPIYNSLFFFFIILNPNQTGTKKKSQNFMLIFLVPLLMNFHLFFDHLSSKKLFFFFCSCYCCYFFFILKPFFSYWKDYKCQCYCLRDEITSSCHFSSIFLYDLQLLNTVQFMWMCVGLQSLEGRKFS